MDSVYYRTSDGELYHHGIKGMKWGIRRYQNKDGSLTKAGERHRAALESELSKLGGKSGSQSSSDSTPQKKTIRDLSDDELRAVTNRMQLEKNYYEAARNLANVNPKQVSKGKKFMDGLVNDVIVPSAKTVGKDYLTKVLKDALGLKEEKSMSWDDKLKKQTYEKNDRERVLDDIKRDIQILDQKTKLEKKRQEIKDSKKRKDDDDDD